MPAVRKVSNRLAHIRYVMLFAVVDGVGSMSANGSVGFCSAYSHVEDHFRERTVYGGLSAPRCLDLK